MTRHQLRLRITTLPEHQPITEQFECDLEVRALWVRSPSYRSQKEHWLRWLADYVGPGAYSRQNWDRTAEFVYNHIVCPPMTLWLGEASGVPGQNVSDAASAALEAGAYLSAQSGAIRRVIPWSALHERLKL
jgi:hypothetical protein